MAVVLIVDDEKAITDLLSEIIAQAGHIPITASNGYEALELAHQYFPSLVISDIKMPFMDGHALLAALRSHPTFAHTIMILMSAQVTTTEMYSSEATAFLLKPLELNLINACLGVLE